MVLEYINLSNFNELFKWQSEQNGFPEEIKKLEQIECGKEENVNKLELEDGIQKRWTTSFMKKWISIEPYLSNIDLRDYFWIARDRLQSTLSNISMVSPFIRKVFEELISGNDGKRNKALDAVKEFNEEELVVIYELLERHINQNPGNKLGYDIARSFIERDISRSMEFYRDIFKKSYTKQIPPAAGIDAMTLMESKEELKIILEPVIDELTNGSSPFAKALKIRKNKKRGVK